ncbi:MAG: diguanylate cyclase [Roseateles sp.]|uniref:diguanylate cyclase domain-containing protein n=1 Tax=Roseateles sp. TaxID=1971397 RepID=UPI0039E974C0
MSRPLRQLIESPGSPQHQHAAWRWVAGVRWRHPKLLGALLGTLLDDPRAQALGRTRLGLLHARFCCLEVLGRGPELLAGLLDAQAQARAQGWHPENARLLCAVGRIAYAHADYQDAVQRWALALDVARLCGATDAEIEARIGLGQVHDAMGDRQRAARLHGDARALADALQDDYLVSKAAINQGVNLRALGELDAARSQLRHAHATARRGGVRHYVAESGWQLADLGLLQGRLDEALDEAQLALRLARAAGNGWLLGGAHRTLADILQRQGRLPEAQAAYERALQQAQRTGARRQLMECHEALARLHERTGDFAAALGHTRAAMQLQAEVLRQLHVVENLEALRQHDLSERPPLERLLLLSEELQRLDTDKAGSLARLCASGRDILHADALMLWEWDEQAPSPHCAARAGDADAALAARYVAVVQCRLDDRSELRALHDLHNHPDFLDLAPTLAALGLNAAIEVPLRQQGRLAGLLLALRRGQEGGWSRDEVLFAAHLAALANQLESARRTRQSCEALQVANETLEQRVAERTAALELSNRALSLANEALNEASLTDPLTGLRNRRYLLQHIEADVALARRHAAAGQNEGLAFFLIDIDHFKRINDEHGHDAGDQVLQQVAQRLGEVKRAADHLVRWGGEEFLLVARRPPAAAAAQIAERLCQVLRERPFPLHGGRALAVSGSVGWAVFPAHAARDWTEVLALADRALYRAKQQGRDRWAGAGEGGPPLPQVMARRG